MQEAPWETISCCRIRSRWVHKAKRKPGAAPSQGATALEVPSCFVQALSSSEEIAMTRRVLAIDIGATRVRVAVIEEHGALLWRESLLTLAKDGPTATLERISAVICRALASDQGGPVSAMGIGAPGPLNPWEGVIYDPPNLPGWNALPLKRILQDQFGLPVHLGNDANLAGLGEHRYGAGRGVGDMVYLTISTGIGGGIISKGRLLLGADGLAGEIGHMAVEARGPRCNCGNRGCLEVMASGPAIARRAAREVRRCTATNIAARAGDNPSAVTAEMVVGAALAGDAVARQIVERAGLYVGVGVVNLVHTLNPRLIVIGGGVALGAGDLLLDPVRAAVTARAMPPFRRELRIVPASLGDDAGLLGALALALSGGDA
jgi:glucokinase